MRMIVSGGGTGGHIYPAVAIAKELLKQDPTSAVLYVGSKRGLEGEIVPKQGIKFVALEIQGFKRSLSLDNFKTVALFLKSVRESKKIIKDFKPDVVIGTGGYVSGAVLYAAARSHVATMIHEENSVAGLTNKFLSHFVDKIGIQFPEAKAEFPAQKVEFVGNPRAEQVAHMNSDFNWSEIGLVNDAPTVLIFGGSQGAPKINDTVVGAINQFNKRKYQVVFVTGAKRFAGVSERLQKMNVGDNVKVFPYINNMPRVLPKVSVIVGRAGATSIAEITALGIPAILIPSPYVIADHQTKNSLSLVNQKAALMITEADLTPELLVKHIDRLMNDEEARDQMRTASKKLGVPDSTDRILKLVKSIKK